MKRTFQLALVTVCSSALFIGCATTPTPNPVAPINSKKVMINHVSPEKIGAVLGHIEFSDSSQGLMIQTQLKQLPPGPHGFHIHENPSCLAAEKDGKMVAALAAGGHYNPYQLPNHGTPYTGHLGDLPLLLVDTDGSATTTLIAPRLKVKDIIGRSVMIHAGGDNYSDYPKPLGGGGDRIACGVIE